MSFLAGTDRMNLRDVPDEVYAALAEAAETNRQSLSAFVVDASALVAFYSADDPRCQTVAARLAGGVAASRGLPGPAHAARAVATTDLGAARQPHCQ